MAEIEDMVEALLKSAVDAGSEVSDEEASKILKSISGSDSSTPSVEGSQDNSTDQQSCDTEEVAAALIQLNTAIPSQPRAHRAAAARARAQPRPAAEPTRRSQRQRSKAPQAAASEGVPAVADGPAAAAEQDQGCQPRQGERAMPAADRGKRGPGSIGSRLHTREAGYRRQARRRQEERRQPPQAGQGSRVSACRGASS
ncbi:hypothetical protein WJX75_008091 [Coccomyxa subellipsoidea]|uniref:Uncharacterized protein n=1 Tax=Coccomyxa subellipsoidea TaxID=248742 RepID=A0ABR2YI97_9CHLO